MNREEVNTYPILVSKAYWLTSKIMQLRSRIDSPRIPLLTGQPGARTVLPGSAQEHLADEYLDAFPMYEDELKETREHILRIEAAVQLLPEKERLVTRLHCFERHGYKWIASYMDLSISTITVIQLNAYKLLEEQEEKDG